MGWWCTWAISVSQLEQLIFTQHVITKIAMHGSLADYFSKVIPRKKHQTTSLVVELLMKELLRQYHRWDSIRLMERYVELCGKQLRRPILFLRECGWRGCAISTWQPIGSVLPWQYSSSVTPWNDQEWRWRWQSGGCVGRGGNTRQEGVMECKLRTRPTKISKEIVEESAPDTVAEVTKETVHWWAVSSLSPHWRHQRT